MNGWILINIKITILISHILNPNEYCDQQTTKFRHNFNWINIILIFFMKMYSSHLHEETYISMKKERKIASFLQKNTKNAGEFMVHAQKDVFCINAFSARGMFAIKRWLKGFQWLTFTLNLWYWFMGAHNTYFDLKLNTKTRKDQIFLLLRVGLNYT